MRKSYVSITTLRPTQTEESQQAIIDMIVEATPQQNAQLRACLSRLVTVTQLEVESDSEEAFLHLVVGVRDEMLDVTRREIQRLATDCRVFLRRCEPIKSDQPSTPPVGDSRRG
jgi:hypothetical protein